MVWKGADGHIVVSEPLPPAYAPPPPPLCLLASAAGAAAGGEGDEAPLWAACWARCRLESMPGFPLWTYEAPLYSALTLALRALLHYLLLPTLPLTTYHSLLATYYFLVCFLA